MGYGSFAKQACEAGFISRVLARVRWQLVQDRRVRALGSRIEGRKARSWFLSRCNQPADAPTV